ncbi:ATP synthase F0 subunit B [Streptomyces himalayensis]|uniref:ATP synthase F0 subunit B n=1 Tax=Streptomyces himalayensis subsp. himalayensis TaxID=2756131 RepID=A0A7W0DI36_9ACTN|nr:ATP synthase F0 subunit B [Streptomyces himalayensis]MBA2944769.1 ATP synthase F0 subunit B [Streptomyces himalayensis subsp. himalayensis]
MDVQKKLDEIVAAVGNARSMPMSASCVVNRAELLSMLEEVRQALPGSLAQAQELIGDREQMVEQARQEAERIIESAHAERGSLISDTEIARRSQSEAERILDEARKAAEEIRAEADDYVDSKLANFEVVLNKTLGSVGRGREKLLGTGPGLDEQGYEDEDAPQRSHDPETLRRTADQYVDTKLGAFEAVLAKTLEAVGRGRQKLHGRIATDELGALGPDGLAHQHTSDAEYLADLAQLADPAEPSPFGSQPQSAPAQSGSATDAHIPAQQPYQQQDAYSPTLDFARAGGAPIHQDPYAYQQQDQYGYQQPYGQQDPYGYQQAYDQSGQQPQQAYDPGQGQEQGYGHGRPGDGTAALDETSLFDTSMISAEQLRQYEQGR